MFIITRNPRKIIQEFDQGKSPKKEGYVSCPAFNNNLPKEVKVKPDIEPIEFRTKKFIYGQKDIEV